MSKNLIAFSCASLTGSPVPETSDGWPQLLAEGTARKPVHVNADKPTSNSGYKGDSRERPTLMTLNFHCQITLPDSGNFHMKDYYLENPQKFLKEWIEGSISNIYSGSIREAYTGALIDKPKVIISVE